MLNFSREARFNLRQMNYDTPSFANALNLREQFHRVHVTLLFLRFTEIMVQSPCIFHILNVVPILEKRHSTILFEGSPVATDDSIMSNDGLEDATVVVGVVSVLSREHNVTAFVGDEVFVIGRNQQEFAFSESPCAAIVCHVEFPTLPFL